MSSFDMVTMLRENRHGRMQQACRGGAFWRIDLYHKTPVELVLDCASVFGPCQAGIRA
jgi:hypothetical protein